MEVIPQIKSVNYRREKGGQIKNEMHNNLNNDKI